MSPDRPQPTESIEAKAREIFLLAIEQRSPKARDAVVAYACGSDGELREAVERLLDSHDELGPYDIEQDTPRLSAAIEYSPGQFLGPFKLREKIGEGGMGVVYVAEQFEPVNRKVAIKLIKPGLDTRQVLARFEAERQTLARMDHPNIARILDADATESGQSYFVMELVQGVPITEYCDQHGLNVRQRLETFIKVCRAIRHAHQKGVIHRDLKPSNVLVSSIDGQAVPKVIDFGVAKAAGPKLSKETVYTQFSQMVGTPLYMSPEQTELGVVDVDTRSDVYALGVMLYELLTGHTPFDRERLREAEFDELRRIIREEEPNRPSAAVSTLNAQSLSTVAEHRCVQPRRMCAVLQGELDWIVMKAIEKDRNRRYESASDLAADLQRYLDRAPILAGPPSLAYRTRKSLSRNRMLFTIAGSVFVALTFGLGIAVWQAAIAQQNATRAAKVSKQERAARQQAQANLRIAIEAVNDMYHGLATVWLASDNRLSDIQQHYLQKAADFYTRLLDHREQYNLTDIQAAEIAWQTALLLRKTDQLQEALERLTPATASFAQSMKAVSDDLASTESLELLANMYTLNGTLATETNDFERALESLTNANLVCERLGNRDSSTELTRFKQAGIANNLALVYQSQGKLDLEEQALQTAEEIYEQLGFGKAANAGHAADYLRISANVAALLLRQGKASEAEDATRRALILAGRHLMMRGTDDRNVRRAQALLLSNLARSLFQQKKLNEAEGILEQLMEQQVALLSIGTEPPNYSFAQFMGMVHRYPGFDEPQKWSDWLRSLLMLAEVKHAKGQPIAAENLLGRAGPVTIYLRVLFSDSEQTRYAIDAANLFAVTAAVLQDRNPDEAAKYAALAARQWQQLLSRVPHLASRPSDLRPPSSDYEWFIERFPNFDVRDERQAEIILQTSRHLSLNLNRMSLDDRGKALLCIEFEEWQMLVEYLTRATVQRSQPEPYDLLTLSLALVQLKRFEEAQARFEEAVQLIGPDASVEPVVAERLQQVTTLLKNQSDGVEP